MLKIIERSCPACGAVVRAFNVGKVPVCDYCREQARILKIGVKEYERANLVVNDALDLPRRVRLVVAQ